MAGPDLQRERWPLTKPPDPDQSNPDVAPNTVYDPDAPEWGTALYQVVLNLLVGADPDAGTPLLARLVTGPDVHDTVAFRDRVLLVAEVPMHAHAALEQRPAREAEPGDGPATSLGTT
jgi:hypothetical protein